jgi:D-alanyl-lipoteichoic acid acyltransferase DltB (MBOAT superfamily)
MLFNSLHFAFFFPAVTVTYFALPDRFRTLFLLAASYYFYMAWRPAYIVVILFLTWVDYYAAKKIESLEDPHRRRQFLGLCLFCNLGILAGFKYVAASSYAKFLFNYLAVESGWKYMNVVLPLGLSFHTFQSMGYVMDVYRGVRPAEKRLSLYALYVAYFPQMVSGPIERSTGLLDRLQSHYDFDYARVTSGLRLMAWGFS